MLNYNKLRHQVEQDWQKGYLNTKIENVYISDEVPTCWEDVDHYNFDFKYLLSKINDNIQNNKKDPEKFPLKYLHWNWCTISSNPSITFETIKNHPHLPWDWCG